MLNPLERQFLEAAEKGNRPVLEACLAKQLAPLNINAVDAMGRTAIEIAVDNENLGAFWTNCPFVAIILSKLQKSFNFYCGSLPFPQKCAIREGVYELVEVLVNHPSITKDMLGEGWAKYLDPAETATSEYSSDICPVILAAHLNQFEILQMLLRKDASIEKPHKHYCACEMCDSERINDGLHRSLKRISTYRALASPAWISLTSSDPILSAFKLSRELQKRAKVEDEFKDQYLQFAEQCKQYACDLLSQCRSTEEVMAVLNKEDNFCNEEVDLSAAKCSLARLKLAIKYEQKTFVAHPHCQQLLTSIWYEGFPLKRHRSSSLRTLLIALLLVLGWPLMAICYIASPKSRVGEIVRSPFMKFLYYSTSFGCFLALLTMVVLQVTFEAYREQTGEVKGGRETRAADRGPTPTLIEWLVFIWVLGMLWSEIKQMWLEGFTKYIHQWWNWLDFVMVCLYLCTISIRFSAYLIYVVHNFGEQYTPRHVVRTHWDAFEPMLVSEALFAVGNVFRLVEYERLQLHPKSTGLPVLHSAFSFARIIYLFQTNPYLGPLQISLGCMLVDVAKFCFIFVLIISSFSIGLAQLYWYYDSQTPVCLTSNQCKTVPNAFSSIANSYMTLLWSLFSITKVEDTEVVEAHHFTVWVGRGLFILYHMTSIIVLLNMLIAMMSHSFERINDHADLEWKFHRSKLWMAHFDEGSKPNRAYNDNLRKMALSGSTLPPPFNIVPTPKACFHTCRAVVNVVNWCFGRYSYATAKERSRATIRVANDRRWHDTESGIGGSTSGAREAEPRKPVTYTEIIQRLKKSMKMDGVNEDDLLEIKQDISSLRYELRDDRRKEIVRSSSHIDAVKREIMRSMSTTTRIFGNPPRRQLSVKERSVAEEADSELDDSSMAEEGGFESIRSPLALDSLRSATLSPLPFITIAAGGDTQFQYAEREASAEPFRYRTRPPAESGLKERAASMRSAESEWAKRKTLGKGALAEKRSAPAEMEEARRDDDDDFKRLTEVAQMMKRLRDSIDEQLDRLAERFGNTDTAGNTAGDGDRPHSQQAHAVSSCTSFSPSRVSFSSAK
ncbi:bifunctional tryptophan synthase trp1 [Globodera pallida]|nr:bifunctional tryptophan synthase trp1 [Globodera pallida]